MQRPTLRKAAALLVLGAATVASIATSPPYWGTSDSAEASFLLPPGTGETTWEIQVIPNSEARDLGGGDAELHVRLRFVPPEAWPEADDPEETDATDTGDTGDTGDDSLSPSILLTLGDGLDPAHEEVVIPIPGDEHLLDFYLYYWEWDCDGASCSWTSLLHLEHDLPGEVVVDVETRAILSWMMNPPKNADDIEVELVLTEL